MRDYHLHEARSRQAYGRWTMLARVVANWRARKTLKLLRGFSDYQLRDIGLTRGDLECMIGGRLNVDHSANADLKTRFEAMNSRARRSLIESKVKFPSPLWGGASTYERRKAAGGGGRSAVCD